MISDIYVIEVTFILCSCFKWHNEIDLCILHYVLKGSSEMCKILFHSSSIHSCDATTRLLKNLPNKKPL